MGRINSDHGLLCRFDKLSLMIIVDHQDTFQFLRTTIRLCVLQIKLYVILKLNQRRIFDIFLHQHWTECLISLIFWYVMLTYSWRICDYFSIFLYVYLPPQIQVAEYPTRTLGVWGGGSATHTFWIKLQVFIMSNINDKNFII